MIYFIELTRQVARLRALLAGLEWSGGFGVPTCPFCDKWQVDGHDHDCWLKAALDEPDPPLPRLP